MDKALKDLYYENLQKFHNNQISQEAWCEFCRAILVQLMIDED